MATATDELTQNYRYRSLAVRAAALKQLTQAWSFDLGDIDGSWRKLEPAVLAITELRHRDAANLAGGYYMGHRAASGVLGTPDLQYAKFDRTQAANNLHLLGPILTKKAIAANQPNADKTALVRVAGEVTRLTLAGGRDTLTATVLADASASGWRRITSGKACEFCRMLAGRGAVYKEQTVRFQSHGHCSCQPEPQYGKSKSITTIPEPVPQEGVEAPLEIPDKVAIDGMTPQDAADFVNTINDLRARFPEVYDGLDHIGTGYDAKSIQLMRDMVTERANATVGRISQDRIDLANNYLDQGRFFPAYQALFNDNIHGVYFDDKRAMIVRPRQNEMANEELDPGAPNWHVKAPDDWSAVKYTTIHEFGHAVDFNIVRRLGDRTPLSDTDFTYRKTTLGEEMGFAVPDASKDIPYVVTNADNAARSGSNVLQDAVRRTGFAGTSESTYAKTNSYEGFAETFTAYEAGTGGAAVPKLIALADEAESWPRYSEPRPNGIMTDAEWKRRLEEIGPLYNGAWTPPIA